MFWCLSLKASRGRLLESLFGAYWRPPGGILGPLGNLFAAFWGLFGGVLKPLGASRGRLKSFSRASWALGDVLRASWGLLRASWTS